jgi:DNA-binding IclR family transcriptional regulator
VPENRYRIEAVYHAGKILETVADSKVPMGSAEIAKALGINANAAFRQCETLEELRFLQKLGDKYDLGMGLALIWARKKSRLEADRDRVNGNLAMLNDLDKY